MASSQNLSSLEAWAFRPSFPDTWISEAFARDTDALTKALQKSLSRETDPTGPTILIPSPTYPIKPEPAGSAQASGSDPETASKRTRNPVPSSSGKITKRKSRATKRSPTTFITADPSNFRQMVQQVTGTRFGNPHVAVPPVLKPEPQRLGTRVPPGCLPTLDTSAFLLDHHQQVVGPAPQAAAQVSFTPVADCAGLDFEAFPSFPTLESWRVM
ncbi:calmodulin-binding protein 25-like [Magnolia sinica]|uniref:calmodulin-binding protein 25-like n=1 Tax=Magnolia sinica TaxID=86752 RepID=UPI0026596876|nr:calmodulin-binding protein 25-like [Magnolia sinica]